MNRIYLSILCIYAVAFGPSCSGSDGAEGTGEPDGQHSNADTHTNVELAADSDSKMNTGGDTNMGRDTVITDDTDTDTDDIGFFFVAGDWHGYGYTGVGEAPGGTISELTQDYTAGAGAVCVNGTLVEDYSSVGTLGMTVNQNLMSNEENGWTPGSNYTGVTVDLSKNIDTPIRMNLLGEDGNTYCAVIPDGETTLDWSDFATACWGTSGVTYDASIAIMAVELYAPGVLDQALAYDYCLNDLYPVPAPPPDTDVDTNLDTDTGDLPPPDCVPNGRAHNPIVSHIYTADPNAIVYGDRVYVYVSHDADGQNDYDMIDHHVFSSDDLANWQDHGVAIRTSNLNWASRLFAPTACKKGDKYYMYLTNGGSQIGVVESDHPGGPFVDPLGHGILSTTFPNANVPWLFDPACFIDDDGQAYLYFGGGPSNDHNGQYARVVRLNDNMVSIMDSEATIVPTTAFFEASFMHKREGKYYFSYSSNYASGHGAQIEYYMGDSPMMDGAQYKGVVLNNAGVNSGNNNHASIVEFNGKTYIFYHNRKLTNERGSNNSYERSVAVQELTYAADGSINEMNMSANDFTVNQLKCLEGFSEVEAERLAMENGIEVDGDAGGTVRIADIDSGDWVAYSQVNFRDGATQLVAQVAAGSGGGFIDVVIDGCINGSAGESVGICNVASTGGTGTFAALTCNIDAPGGPHDLCLKFSGNTNFELDSFHLK